MHLSILFQIGVQKFSFGELFIFISILIFLINENFLSMSFNLHYLYFTVISKNFMGKSLFDRVKTFFGLQKKHQIEKKTFKIVRKT